jgi:ribosomal protein L10
MSDDKVYTMTELEVAQARALRAERRAADAEIQAAKATVRAMLLELPQFREAQQQIVEGERAVAMVNESTRTLLQKIAEDRGVWMDKVAGVELDLDKGQATVKEIP